ncbi:MAG: hypothetical protein OXI24_02705, partial [Candidatus Poribacteria bacterium]|nr:hypothetical protein [Candidatus Poribacteria bacterium]
MGHIRSETIQKVDSIKPTSESTRENNPGTPNTPSVQRETSSERQQLLKAENPVALFTNAIGDFIMTLPALRALCFLFPERLTVVCPDWASNMLSANLPHLRNIIAPPPSEKMFHIDAVFQDDLSRATFSKDLRQRLEKNGLSLSKNVIISVEETDRFWRITDKDSGEFHFAVKRTGRLDIISTMFCDYVDQRIKECDLLLSLNPWHSREFDRLLERLAPTDSVGFYPAYSKQLVWSTSEHSVDMAFKVPQYLNPALRPESFAETLKLPRDCEQLAERWRKGVPPSLKVLAVHADTKEYKMWPTHRFVSLLDKFLERHPNFVVMVVGTQDLQLNQGQHGNKVYPCYGQPLAFSFALVGTRGQHRRQRNRTDDPAC